MMNDQQDNFVMQWPIYHQIISFFVRLQSMAHFIKPTSTVKMLDFWTPKVLL